MPGVLDTIVLAFMELLMLVGMVVCLGIFGAYIGTSRKTTAVMAFLCALMCLVIWSTIESSYEPSLSEYVWRAIW